MRPPIEKKSLDNSKPVKTKGASTVGVEPTTEPIPKIGNELQTKKPFPKALEYEEPANEQESFVGNIASRAGSSTTSGIKGTTGLINTEALNAIYAPVDLAQGLPDYHEREKFKAYHGEKLVKLFGDDTYGIRFERDLEDMAIFKEKQYPLAVKKFMDDLDENQGWYTELALSTAKFLGKTALSVGSVVPTIYGAGAALIAGDSSKVFDNTLFDAWEYMDQGMDKHLSIYGGSDVWNFDTETGEFAQKEFVGRFWNDPLKSINADVVPAASFVAGAIVTELLAGALTAGTGGLAGGFLAANTARLAAQVGSWGGRLSKFTKANRIIRGLDKLDGIKDAARIEKMTKTYRSGMGTLASGYRSASYESALIARDTQDATLQKLLSQHSSSHVDADGKPIEPTNSEMAEYERAAADAGESAYFMNIPLVAGSNFIQMPRLFMKNYSIARAGGSVLKRTKLAGTRYIKDTKGVFTHAANAESKLLRRLGYAKAVLRGPVTEGWEEFAQGAMQEGLVDYYAQNYSADSNRNMLGMLDAIRKQGSSYLNTVEGRDSVTIGALMGLVGMRAPVRIDSKTGKMSFSARGTAFGGSAAAARETRDKISKARNNAEELNASPIDVSPMLKQNMDNAIRHQAIQADMDEAAIEGDVNTFKNKEHATLFSSIYNKVSQGMGDSIFQEINALEESSLENFNELYSTKGLEEYTEDTKQEAIDKAKSKVAGMVKSIEETREVLNKMPPDLLQKAITNVTNAVRKNKKATPINPMFLNDAMKQQLAYLHSTVQDTKLREAELTQQIGELTNNIFGLDSMNKVAAQMVGVTKEGTIEFANKAEETKKAILQDWKENDLVGYNMNIHTVEPLLDDILKLKVRRGESSKMYQGMLTPKGAKLFAGFAQELLDISMKDQAAKMEKMIKDNASKSRNAGIDAESLNEKSVYGTSDITNLQIDKSAKEGLVEYSAINWEMVEPGKEDLEIQRVLDKHPGLLSLVKARLKHRGLEVTGIKTSEDIWNIDTNGEYVTALYADLLDLQKEYERRQSVKDDPKFDNSEDGNQPSNEGSTNPSTYTKLKGQVLEEVLDYSNEVGTHHIFINTHDKVITNGKVELDPETGKPVPHPAAQDPTYPLDSNKVNSPDFLNNELLNRSHVEFEIRVQKNNPYSENATVENMPLEVVHVDPTTKKETFISRLPAVTENTPAHLLALREEVIRRDGLTNEDVQAAQEERNAEIKALKEEKAIIKSILLKGVKKPKSKNKVEEAKQKVLEDKVEELIAKDKTFREEDGSVLDENMTAWKQNKADIIQAKEDAKRGNLEKGLHASIDISTIVPGDNNNKTLTGKEEIAAEEKIEAVIQQVLNGKMTAEEAVQFLVAEYAWDMNDIKSVTLYIRDRTTDAPEIGNNKQSFKAWRKGEYDVQPSSTETKAQTEEEIFNEKLELQKKLLEVQDEIDNLKNGPQSLIQQIEKEIAYEKGEFGNAKNIKPLEDQIKKIKADQKKAIIKTEAEKEIDDTIAYLEENKEDIEQNKKIVKDILEIAKANNINLDEFIAREDVQAALKKEDVAITALINYETKNKGNTSKAVKKEIKRLKKEWSNESSAIDNLLKGTGLSVRNISSYGNAKLSLKITDTLLEKTTDKKTLTPEKVKEVIKQETTKEDVSAIAKEENITEEEAETLIKTSVIEHIKKFGNKLIKAPKTRLKKLINKIVKGIMGMIIAGTLIVGASSFSNTDGNVSFNLENAVETLLPDTQAQWAKRFLDKQGLIDMAEEQMVEEAYVPVIEETPKPEKIFQIIGTVHDSYTAADSLISYRSQWDNSQGFKYIATPVKKDMTSNMKISGVVGVGHFLMDASAAPGKSFSMNKIAGLVADTNSSTYIPTFTNLPDGGVLLKYKQAKDINDADRVVAPLRQWDFSDVNFASTGKPNGSGFGNNIKAVKTHSGETTHLMIKNGDRNAMGRMSGGSFVFIFQDKHDNTIVRDFAGSINQIENEGINITEEYGLQPGELIIGVHDAASFNAKPKAKDGVINTDQWAGFHNAGYTGGALLIPIEGNITPPAQAPSEGGLGLLGLTLLGALAAVRKKQSNNEEITDEDIDTLEKLKAEILTSIDNVIDPVKETTENTTEDTARTEELKARLSEVNAKLSELDGGFKTDLDTESSSIFGPLNEFLAISPRAKKRKAKAKAKLEETFGQENIDRAIAINKNFNNIVNLIQDSKIPVFINPETGTHSEC